MTELEAKIHSICGEIIRSAGYIFIDAKIRGNKTGRVIEVYADAENPLTIEDCAALSRAINEKFETDLDPAFQYRLDVSSPGADKPLVDIRQYKKHTGRTLQIEYLESDGSKAAMTGVLKEITEGTLHFEIKGKEIRQVEFESIQKAIVTISFK